MPVLARPRRSSSLTTEIYNEFPVQPGRKFARARPLVPTTLHKRYRRRIAHSDLKQPFRQCGDAFVAVARNTRPTSRVARGKIYRPVFPPDQLSFPSLPSLPLDREKRKLAFRLNVDALIATLVTPIFTSILKFSAKFPRGSNPCHYQTPLRNRMIIDN